MHRRKTPAALLAATLLGLGLGMALPGSLALAAGPPMPDVGKGPLAGQPDFRGVWMGTGGHPGIPAEYRNTPWPKMEFAPWGAEESKRITKIETPDECKPYGPVPFMNGGGLFPLEIAYHSKGLLLMSEPSAVVRRIYLDGRPLPEDPDPIWMGHSVGHWEGSTLVVETVGTNGRGRPLNGYISGAINSRTDMSPRLPVSDAARVTERFRLLADGKYLEVQITLHDSKAYTNGPFTVRRYYERRNDLDVIEYFCDDNRRPEDEGHAGETP